ncbi:MAG TPA: CBS domain-containing protein [Candidatus Cloacimonetes bacterium]|nr:CBS domain-containing protein [Candidatus Cloacimonadota bacterium]
MPEDRLAKVKVRDIDQLIIENPSVIDENSSLIDLLREIIKDTRSRHVYVVNKKNKLIGSVRLNNTIQYMFPATSLLQERENLQISSFMLYSSAKTVKDIMTTNPSYVFEDTLLLEMIRIMIREKVNELPVVDKQHQVIGEVNFLEVIDYYLKNIDL